MSEFELDEGAVAQTEAKLFETGEIVKAEADKARDTVTGAAGAWLGAANVAATNKQTGDFSAMAQRLQAEINHISEALGLGRQASMAEDQANEQAFMGISPEGNYGRI